MNLLVPLINYFILSSALLCVGIYGLIAKRNALGASQDDKIDELRSESTTSPEESLSDNAQGAVTKEPVGNLLEEPGDINQKREEYRNQKSNLVAIKKALEQFQ